MLPHGDTKHGVPMTDNIEDASGEGGYVFISHNHLDFDKVRIIRNTLEEKGFEPLCFFLKCLSDDDEIDALIKREIDSRSLFVYAKSRNSENSSWVQRELSYIESTGRKIDRVIDLESGEDLTTVAGKLMDSMRVFVSYSRRDWDVVQKVIDRLKSRDLRIFGDWDLALGSDWYSDTKESIRQASEHGCVLLFDSRNSSSSESVNMEIEYANACQSDIVCVDIDDGSGYRPTLPTLRHLLMSDPPKEEEIENVVDTVESVLVQKFKRSVC